MMSRSWQIWDKPGFAETYSRRWGNPAEPPETWERGQRWRTQRAAELLEGGSVLDVGAGLGHLYAVLRKTRPEVGYVGVDVSPEMVAYAHHAFPEADFRVGDVYDLSPLPVFDSVACPSVLLHLPDPWDKPIRELWSHAAKCLVFTTIVDDGRPRVEHMEDNLIYNVSTVKRVLDAADALPGKHDTEFWVSDVYGAPGSDFIMVRCLRRGAV